MRRGELDGSIEVEGAVLWEKRKGGEEGVSEREPHGSAATERTPRAFKRLVQKPRAKWVDYDNRSPLGTSAPRKSIYNICRVFLSPLGRSARDVFQQVSNRGAGELEKSVVL